MVPIPCIGRPVTNSLSLTLWAHLGTMFGMVLLLGPTLTALVPAGWSLDAGC